MLKVLAPLFLVFALVSCGGKAGKTQAKISFFKSSIAGLGTDADGGLMLWGRGPNEDFARVVDTSAPSLSFEVSNGSWTFWAVAWQKTTYEMDGIPKCAIANADFNGGASAVELTLSNANCQDTDFSIQPLNGVTGSKTFPTVDIVSCNQLSGIVNQTSHTAECAYSNGKKGYALSYEIVYPEYRGANFTGVELVSDCQVVPNTDSNPTALFNSLPVPGNGTNPFGVIVRAWLDSTDCGTSNPEKGYIDDFFPLGLNQNQVAIRYNGGSETIRFHQLTTELDICQGLRLDALAGFSPFASGRGDFRPYTICTEEQFNSIGLNYGSYNASNFEQVADLNYSFNPFDPFVPIGDDLDTNAVAATTFTGDYNGNSHYVDGVILFERDISDLGFIRQMGTGFVKNLILNNFVIESEQNGGTSDNIALLIGESSGTNISNIKVHGHTKGNNNIGGLVGWQSSGGASFTITDSLAFISADGQQNIGGLIGSSNNSSSAFFINKASASVDLHGNFNTNTNVGGLVGSISGGSTGTISEASSKGIIQGSQSLGGLIGGTPDAVNIVDSYSTVSLLSRINGGTNHNIGGLVGSSLASLDITRSFATLGYQRGDTTGGNANSIGGAVGINNCNPVDTYFTGNDNSGTGGCGTVKTLAQLYDQTTYTSGSWGANISFTDLTKTWSHNTTEDDNDYPRLSWELKTNISTGAIVEDEGPFLKRPCTNNYASLSGTGSEADPFQICTAAQFLAMTTSSYYALARDIDLTDQPLGTGPLFSAGQYRLDGLNKSIYNYKIAQTNGSGELGLFEQLTAGSEIENLFIANVDITITGTPTADLNAGILTAINYGALTNVNIEGASLGFDASYIHPSGFDVSAAGLTAFNGASGIISGTEVEADLTIRNANLGNVTGTDSLNISGLVVRNDGIITSSVISGYLELQSAGAAEDSRDGVILSAINNINNNTIEKVHSRMGIGVNNNGLGNIYSTLGFGTNNGSISDILIGGNFNLTNVSSGSLNNYLLFGDNTGGNSIERIVASSTYSDNTMGIATGSTHGTNTGTLSDAFCFEYSTNAFSTPIACYTQANKPYFSTTKAMALYSPDSPTATANGNAMALGDIDGDLVPDLVVANGSASYSFSVFTYNTSTNLFNTETTEASGGQVVVDIKIVDLDSDGDNDVVIGTNNGGNSEVTWFENTDGSGTFTSASLHAPADGSVMKKIDVADYNGDGDIDIVVLTDITFTYLDNNGSEVFSPTTPTTPGAAAVDFVSADFDNDGLIDLVISENSSNQVRFLQNTTPNSGVAATFGGILASTTTVAGGAGELDFGDVNEDGNLDLAVVLPGDTESLLMLGDGAGNFSEGYHLSQASDVKLRDVNGDTYLDFLIVNSSTGEVEAVKGNGTIYLEENSVYNCTGCIAVDAVDLNLDGYPEVVAIDPAGFVRHFENQGYVLENMVSTSDDVAITGWDIHQYTETSTQSPLDINADWTISGGELEAGWSEGPDSLFNAGAFP